MEFWSGNENTCTIPGCEEDSVILPGGTGEQEVSIDYTYDALNRLISAEYSNGTAFGYTYNAAGNVLTYAETHYGQTTVTTYTYDAANQLLTATEDETVWQYSYDGNGSLIQTNPGTEVSNGSTRYTYNTAGYLTKVENFTTEWQTQSEMTYDGLGNRLEVTTYSDGEGNTTRYVLDGGTELTAIGSESSTYYLYGLGAKGTLGESWSYTLQDGAGSTRQMVNEDGVVNMSVSYTPWGDTMEIYGSGMLNLGYLGGVYDAGTGLINMGNGQYYDPSTGRFLTRGNNNVNTNPYSPSSSDPAGMLIAPLALLALVFGRKKNKTKFEQFIILFMIFTSIWFMTASFRFQASTNIATTQFLVTPKSQTYDIYDSGTVNNKYLLYIITPYQSINSTYEINCSEHNFPKPTNEIDQYEEFWEYFEFQNTPERKERVIKLGVIAITRAFEREIGGVGTDLFIRVFNLNLSKKMLFECGTCEECLGGMAFTHSAHHIEFNINKLYYSTSVLEYNDDNTPKRWGVCQ